VSPLRVPLQVATEIQPNGGRQQATLAVIRTRPAKFVHLAP
jgi:hypothetical protein